MKSTAYLNQSVAHTGTTFRIEKGTKVFVRPATNQPDYKQKGLFFVSPRKDFDASILLSVRELIQKPDYLSDEAFDLIIDGNHEFYRLKFGFAEPEEEFQLNDEIRIKFLQTFKRKKDAHAFAKTIPNTEVNSYSHGKYRSGWTVMEYISV